MSGAIGALENALANPVSAQPGFWQQGINNLTTLRNYQAQNALAQIYQDPTVVNRLTGEVDQGRLNALIAQSPQASWNAAPAMQAQGQAQGAQADALNQQTAGHLARLKVMSGEMSDLLQSGQPVTADQVHARLNSLGQEGILTTGDMSGLNADLATQPPGADLTGWLRNHMATNLSAAEQLQNVTSQPQTQQLGDRTVVVEGNTRLPGGQRVGTSYVQGLDPATAGDIVSINVNGVQQQMTRARAQQLFGANYQSRVVPGGAGGSGAAPAADGTTAPPSPIPTGGQYIPPPGSQAQGGAAAAGGAAGPPPAGPPPAGPPAAAGGAPGGAAAGAAAAAPSVGMPGGGFRGPAAGAAPPAATTTATPSTPPADGAADGATAQLPVGKDGPYVLGDSIADGVRTTGGWQGNTQVGRNPQQVLGTIGSAPIQGRDVVLSSGAINNPAQAGLLQQQIDAANKAGAKSITVVGTGNPQLNTQLQAIAAKNGANFVPMGPAGRDGIHPADYRPLAAAVVQPAGRQAAAAPPAPAAAPPAGPPPAPATLSGGPPGFGTAFAPGVAVTLEAHARASAEMANAMHANASVSPQRQALLADMDATNKQINTGPKADAATQWSAFVNRLPDNISSLIPGMTRDQVASTEGFAKLAETFRQMQAGGIAGTLTNDKFASALASNPHLALSTLGNAGMIHLLQGSEDAIQAKDRAWSAASTANPGLDYQRWETQYNQTLDPRVYWWARMTNGEQQRLRSGMTQQQQQVLATHLQQAEAAGQIDRNNFNTGN